MEKSVEFYDVHSTMNAVTYKIVSGYCNFVYKEGDNEYEGKLSFSYTDEDRIDWNESPDSWEDAEDYIIDEFYERNKPFKSSI